MAKPFTSERLQSQLHEPVCLLSEYITRECSLADYHDQITGLLYQASYPKFFSESEREWLYQQAALWRERANQLRQKKKNKRRSKRRNKGSTPNGSGTELLVKELEKRPVGCSNFSQSGLSILIKPNAQNMSSANGPVTSFATNHPFGGHQSATPQATCASCRPPPEPPPIYEAPEVVHDVVVAGMNGSIGDGG